MKNHAKFTLLTIVVVFLLCLSACKTTLFHEHDWQEATCSSPKTCRICSATKGTVSKKHDFQPASCAQPKICSLCGERSGTKLKHNINLEGYYCFDCLEGKETYDNLMSIGFQNFDDYSTWLEIDGYEKILEKIECVYAYIHPSNPTHGDYISFKNGYFETGKIYTASGEVSYKQVDRRSYSVSTNDVLRYGSFNYQMIITERIAEGMNNVLLLKIEDEGKERWFIPIDLIDWSSPPFRSTSDEELAHYYLK